jgi:hypothetical protein
MGRGCRGCGVEVVVSLQLSSRHRGVRVLRAAPSLDRMSESALADISTFC